MKTVEVVTRSRVSGSSSRTKEVARDLHLTLAGNGKYVEAQVQKGRDRGGLQQGIVFAVGTPRLAKYARRLKAHHFSRD